MEGHAEIRLGVDSLAGNTPNPQRIYLPNLSAQAQKLSISMKKACLKCKKKFQVLSSFISASFFSIVIILLNPANYDVIKIWNSCQK